MLPQFSVCAATVDAEADAKLMQSSLREALASLSSDEQRAAASLDNMHFATVPMSGVSDKGANFLPNLMGHWTSGRAIMSAQSTGTPLCCSELYVQALDLLIKARARLTPLASAPDSPTFVGVPDG